MNPHVARNVRIFRELKHWTQHLLADAAGVELRTVQRVEAGNGVSADTLAALAAAFDTTIDLLQTDFAVLAAKVQEDTAALERRELEKTHDIIPVTPVTCSADLEVVGGAHDYLTLCCSKDDAVQDVFATLTRSLADMGDLWRDVGPDEHREWVKEAFEHVEYLNHLGFVVCVGKRTRLLPGRTGPFDWRTFCAAAWPKGEVKKYIVIEKSA